ncbi:accessory gene regulator B family protein [Lachnospiraceae bacterium DSM 108991]|uniref:Accessory gene regulator B family protein n=1 Tax=Claveliimonas monacensis TaxID=2779351 RepID=A0ABR9RLL5_9FIRM|nr:accessory gene regulator B family protein [Claveliimonas monacensis]MBE5063865.1 accessory gene regulator B family protein [Claveliimonas monacensis]
MIEKLAKEIVTSFIRNGLVEQEKQLIYTYGAELLISGFVSTAMVLLMGLISYRLFETILLIIPFYFIRIYAGGYHAESYKTCFLSFCIGFVGILLVTDLIIKYKLENFIMHFAIVAAVIICIIAPIEDHSRPLTEKELIQYNKKTKISVVLFLIFSEAVYWRFRLNKMVYISMAIISVFIVLWIGIIKNRIIGFHSTAIHKN